MRVLSSAHHKTFFRSTSHQWFLNKQQNKPKSTFQRWISWFAQRWRTPRNAICNVNCRIKWIIKSLNANGCSGPRGWSMPGPDSFAKRKMHYRIDYGRCHTASLQETMMACAPLASKRCAEVVKHQGALCFTASVATIHALELDSGKRTRWI